MDEPFVLPYWQLSNFDWVWSDKSLAKIFSKTLPGAGVKEIGLRSAKVTGGLDLGMGITLAFFHCDGKVHSYREALIILHMGVAISAANSVRIRGECRLYQEI